MNYRILFVKTPVKSLRARANALPHQCHSQSRAVTVPFGTNSLSETNGLLLERSLQPWRNVYGLHENLESTDFDSDTTLTEKIFSRYYGQTVPRKGAKAVWHTFDEDFAFSASDYEEEEPEVEYLTDGEEWYDLHVTSGRCLLLEEDPFGAAVTEEYAAPPPVSDCEEIQCKWTNKDKEKDSKGKPKCDWDCDIPTSSCESECKKAERERRRREKENAKPKLEDRDPPCDDKKASAQQQVVEELTEPVVMKCADKDEDEDEECPCKEKTWKYPPKPKCPDKEEPKRYERDKNRCPKKDRKCDCSAKEQKDASI